MVLTPCFVFLSTCLVCLSCRSLKRSFPSVGLSGAPTARRSFHPSSFYLFVHLLRVPRPSHVLLLSSPCCWMPTASRSRRRVFFLTLLFPTELPGVPFHSPAQSPLFIFLDVTVIQFSPYFSRPLVVFLGILPDLVWSFLVYRNLSLLCPVLLSPSS